MRVNLKPGEFQTDFADLQTVIVFLNTALEVSIVVIRRGACGRFHRGWVGNIQIQRCQLLARDFPAPRQ